MNIRQSFVTAIRNLFANKVRFFQATLGMVIGIAGFIVSLSLGNISLASIQDRSNEFAPGVIVMIVQTALDMPGRITANDMEQLAADYPDIISGVSSYIESEFSGGVRYANQTEDKAQVYGVGSSYFEMVPVLQLQEGRFLEDMDITRERRVCLVGNHIATDLMGGDALGKELKVWGENYTVIGVFAEVAYSPTRNTEVFIPYTNARKMFGENIGSSNTYNDWYYVCANGKENMYDTQVIVKEMLKERTGREYRNGWYLTVMAKGNTMDKIKDYVIGSIIQYIFFASIVLIIGGVGIMNVMLASVQARTKEIGIRKAFGATAGDIKRQFALEAVITGLIGGLLGTTVGLIGMFFICKYSEVPLGYLDSLILPVLLAMVVSVGVGVIFGTYPARQAAKMEIVEAINCD